MPFENTPPYPVLPRGLVYSTTKLFAAKFSNIQLKATLYIANGPPWISRMSGYFFDASKDGGFTIHPWTLVLPDEVYQISSIFASCLPASTSPLTSVSVAICAGLLRL